jgi:transposase-like protein
MAIGKRTSYFFLGRHPVESAPTLEEAIRNLVDWWTRQPSLVSHEMGNMLIELTIGGTTVQFEITDPKVLDEARYTGPIAVIDYLAKQMGIDEADAKSILEDAEATVEVDTIRVPGEPDAWKPSPGLEVNQVLPESAPLLLREMAREEDLQTGRDLRRARGARGRRLVEMAVRASSRLGISLSEMSRQTGIPRTTLRDTRTRMDRQARVQATFKDRKPGQRLSPQQVQVVLTELQNNQNNAAKTARDLGIAARTVREIRQRTQRAATPARPTGAPRRKYTDSDRTQLLDLVRRRGVTATEAARQLGVPSRTARGWVRKARLEAEEE